MGAPVVIVGAGFAGLATACRLGRSGHDCVVLERRERPEHGGAALVLQPNGLEALGEIGLAERVEDECLTVPVAVQRSPRGRTLARWSYSELGHPHPHVVAIGRSHMLSLLLEATAAGAARVEKGCEVTALVRDGSGRACAVRYRDPSGAEREQAARWLVGADGGGSLVRGWSGARLAGRSGPYRYLLGISRHRPDERAAVMYHGRGWANGAIPMREGADFWDTITAENRAAVERGDFEAWREVYRKRVPDADALLDGFSSIDQLPVLSGRTHRAIPRVRDGVVLAGDAAAAVHPHTGQGANLALVDGVSLGAALAGTGGDGPADSAVFAHAARRDRHLRIFVPMSRVTGYTYDAPNAFWRLLRLGNFASTRIPPLRRALLRQGTGLA